ncbi:MAG TPA: 2-oxoglutarate and iron-dependent oxygenase domain-containing protein [Xanthobacteraceae bacterium]|jgi:isopenicillin N synthase-like dioxygenase|nr:2-oxoglutarate and iron-dependent oxygenase domain-containing protein [Xanthobacteraceae bacterium]
MVALAAKTVASSSLPVIDVAGLGGDFAARRTIAQELRTACVDTGFFYIKGHGVPAALITQVFQQSRAFFALSMEQKLALASANSRCRHGYEPLKAQTLELGAPPDLKEGYLAGDDFAADHPAVLNDPVNIGPNQWPPQLPSFKEAMTSYVDQMKGLGKTLMQGLALSLDLDEDYFDAFCHDPVLTLRLLHYPPQPANHAPNEKGCGAHTDWGGITILLQDDAGGLQVQHADGSWISAPPIAGTFVVNIGDLLARWTNNLYRSTVHRVVNISGRDRYSVPFFLDGQSDHMVSCLPSCASEGRHFADTTVRGHLEEMVRRTYAAAG